uniref:Uncharacterized protein n=1 Tax=Schistosoma curassoni TaxID=6186 RepID=A0A183JU54_9TREM
MKLFFFTHEQFDSYFYSDLTDLFEIIRWILIHVYDSHESFHANLYPTHYQSIHNDLILLENYLDKKILNFLFALDQHVVL